MLKGFKSKRTVIGSIPESETTLFVGLFNGVEYLDKLCNQINEFRHNDVPVVFVDNCSLDQTWELLQEKVLSINRDYLLVRNPANIGGLGSLLTNLDLVKSPWVTTCHQDDFYRENHLAVHLREIREAGENIGVVSTDMGVAFNSSERGLIPRANWDYDPQDKVSCFLGSIKSHLTPNPASSYRINFIKNHSSPYYNMAFSDTEHELSSYLDWDSIWAPEMTVDYVDNPISESKTVEGVGREMAIVNSMCRVFTSKTFEYVAGLVNESDRDRFAKELIRSIQIRFNEPLFGVIVINQALEELLEFWGPTDFLLRHIHSVKSGLGLTGIETVLQASLNFTGGTASENIASPSSKFRRQRRFRAWLMRNFPKLLGLLGAKNSKRLWSYTLRATKSSDVLAQFRSPRFQVKE